MNFLTSRRVLIIQASGHDPLLEETCNLGLSCGSFEVMSCMRSDQVLGVLDQAERAVLVSVLSDAGELKAQEDFCAILKPYVEDGSIILVALSGLEHPDAANILSKMGFAEVISGSSISAVDLKALLEGLFDRLGLEKRSNHVFRIEALTISDDCWLLRGTEDIRVRENCWTVELIGPGPLAGNWSERAPDIWEWRASNASHDFISESGYWVFWGQKPKFENHRWVFISQCPKLTYFRGGDAICDYLVLAPDRQNLLLVASNSEIAKAKWPAIHASIVREPGVVHSQELFQKITNGEIRAELVSEMQRGAGCPVEVWTKGQQVRFTGKLLEDFSGNGSILIHMSKEREASDLMQALSKSPVFVVAKLPCGEIFFSVTQSAVSAHQDQLSVGVPELLYEVQRRLHYRLPFSGNPGVFARIDDQLRKLLNVSEGGLNFLAETREQKILNRGVRLARLCFELDGEMIECSGEVRWSKVVTDASFGEGLSVGVQFVGLKPEDQRKIHLHVLSIGMGLF